MKGAFKTISSTLANRNAGGSRGVPEQSVLEEGVWYACERCTNCCRWPGQVRLSEEDLVAIPAYLGLTAWDFIQRYTRLQASRRGLALTEQPDGACIFLEGRGCRINGVKPGQCRDFPNAWNFPGWREVCEAIPVTIPVAKVERPAIGEQGGR